MVKLVQDVMYHVMSLPVGAHINAETCTGRHVSCHVVLVCWRPGQAAVPTGQVFVL